MGLAEKHELVEALALDGTHEAFGLGVQVGTTGREADGREPSRVQKLTKGDRVMYGNSIVESRVKQGD